MLKSWSNKVLKRVYYFSIGYCEFLPRRDMSIHMDHSDGTERQKSGGSNSTMSRHFAPLYSFSQDSRAKNGIRTVAPYQAKIQTGRIPFRSASLASCSSLVSTDAWDLSYCSRLSVLITEIKLLANVIFR